MIRVLRWRAFQEWGSRDSADERPDSAGFLCPRRMGSASIARKYASPIGVYQIRLIFPFSATFDSIVAQLSMGEDFELL